MKILILFLLIICSISINAKNVCRFPKSWKRYYFNFSCFYICKDILLFFLFSRYDFDYKQRQNEWATTNSKTDYYKLVLSWSPSFCKELPSAQRNRSFQCQYDDFGLIV